MVKQIPLFGYYTAANDREAYIPLPSSHIPVVINVGDKRG